MGRVSECNKDLISHLSSSFIRRIKCHFFVYFYQETFSFITLQFFERGHGYMKPKHPGSTRPFIVLTYKERVLTETIPLGYFEQT